jgi:hypothetical protein
VTEENTPVKGKKTGDGTKKNRPMAEKTRVDFFFTREETEQ